MRGSVECAPHTVRRPHEQEVRCGPSCSQSSLVRRWPAQLCSALRQEGRARANRNFRAVEITTQKIRLSSCPNIFAMSINTASPTPFIPDSSELRELNFWAVSDEVCGQNANRTKCQPDIMPTKGWHFVRTFICGWHFVRPKFLVGILSGSSQHVLAFCHNHENHIL